MKSVENATLVPMTRERVMTFTGVNITLEKILLKRFIVMEQLKSWRHGMMIKIEIC